MWLVARTSPYSLLWESGLLAIVTLNDAHQAATKDEKWLLSYQKSHKNQTLAVINVLTKQSDYIYVRMMFPENSSLHAVYRSSNTFYGNPKYGVTKAYGLFNLYVENHLKT